MNMKLKTNFLAAGIFLTALLNSFGQPVITTDPQSRTSVVGTDVTFTVVATGAEPIAYPPKDRKGLRRGGSVALFESVIAPNILSIRC